MGFTFFNFILAETVSTIEISIKLKKKMRLHMCMKESEY